MVKGGGGGVTASQWPTDLWGFYLLVLSVFTPKAAVFYHTCPPSHSSCFLDILQTSELGVTEHIEGDPCKFALWAGRTPSSDNKTVLKALLIRNKKSLPPFVFVCCQFDGCFFMNFSVRQPAWKPNRSGLKTSGR